MQRQVLRNVGVRYRRYVHYWSYLILETGRKYLVV